MATRTLMLTATALIAFAANSILCRLALSEARIDAATFTAIRLLSGALVLALLSFGSLRRKPWSGSVLGTAALFLYAAPFSYAYLRLGAGIGALVLFGSVQVTMIGWGMWRGERAPLATWIGLVVALAGLAALTAPGASAPDAVGAGLMVVAGVAWGAYSLVGRASSAPPLVTTAANFVGALPLALALAVVATVGDGVASSIDGVALAVASGALASGVGYSIWYAALRDLSATRAAILQLLVPTLAAAGGVIFLGETMTTRALTAGATILSGVAVAVVATARSKAQ